MKLTSIILFFFGMHLSAKTVSQSITLSGKNLALETVFAAVKKQTGFSALFDADDLKGAKPVTINVVNQSLELFLEEVFKGQPLHYSISNTSIFINRKWEEWNEAINPPMSLLSDTVPAINITGTVLDFNGQVLAGATVRVKGKKTTTISNGQGRFEIVVEVGARIIISYAGYVSTEERISSSQHIVVHLEPSAILEEAVVYNGYQKVQQKYLTGSVTSLKMDSILQPGLSTVDKMLEGRVPGMMFMQNSGQSGAAPKLRIRGTTTYLGSREPLWVVDGIIRTSPFPIDAQRLNDPDFVNLLGNAISGLNPFDIEQIDVLKDATAAALYGVRAANGVIVITTKKGKAGPPSLSYNVTGSFTRRPRYTDRSVFMMNSSERVEVSKELIDKELQLYGFAIEAYEKALLEYYGGLINYDTYKQRVDRAETVNTDWLGNAMHDVFATSHTMSISGGSSSTHYRTSFGYRSEPGVIKMESNNLYTGMLNLQTNYRKLKLDFNVQVKKEKRRYTPSEVGVLNYAFGTSRAIPLYNEDGSRYFYSTLNSSPNITSYDLKAMNILNEMDHTGDLIESQEYNASIDLNYEILKGLQFSSKVAYTGGSATQETWFEGNTQWATSLRSSAYNTFLGTFDPARDLMPFGGELRQLFANKSSYQVNARLNYSRYLDQHQKHLFTIEGAADLNSTSTKTTYFLNRGYYPDRGNSFTSVVDPIKYLSYAQWQVIAAMPKISVELQNSMRTYLTSTYILNDRYVLTATTGQEFSNSFGSRSNEKFMPTWALSGRWNLQDDVLKHVSWVNQAALLVSFGTRGNMLPGQTPYSIIEKGSVNAYYNAPAAKLFALPNAALSWEKTHDYSGSIQFSIIDGKINGSMGYFYSKTSNAFLSKRVSIANGVSSYVVNGATLENKGVELSLNFKVIDRLTVGNNKKISWRFDPQLGQVFNKIINKALNSQKVLSNIQELSFEDYLSGSVPVNGKAVNSFYAYRFKGLDPMQGYPVFYGAEPENKDALRSEYNQQVSRDAVYNSVMVEAGRREPVLQGSVNNFFTYGNWAMNVTFTYSVGNKIRLMQIASGNYGTTRPSSQQNMRKEFVNRWRYPGDEKFTNIPGLQPYEKAWWQRPESYIKYLFANDYYQMYDFSDVRVVKGDYLKLQYISLSYRLPNELCKKMNCKGALLQFSGSNLAMISNKALRGQDPSQSGAAPNINLSIRPVYTFNFNLSF